MVVKYFCIQIIYIQLQNYGILQVLQSRITVLCTFHKCLCKENSLETCVMWSIIIISISTTPPWCRLCEKLFISFHCYAWYRRVLLCMRHNAFPRSTQFIWWAQLSPSQLHGLLLILPIYFPSHIPQDWIICKDARTNSFTSPAIQPNLLVSQDFLSMFSPWEVEQVAVEEAVCIAKLNYLPTFSCV